jgi:hypothetical protein
MRSIKKLVIWSSLCFLLFIASCGGGGDSGSGAISETGTVSMFVTDAKPLLPEDNVINFFVEFSEVWVHKSGGGWIQLELVESPYTIDLLQFHDGTSTDLVPPALLSTGKYTQVRIVVSTATMRLKNDDGTTEDRIVEIPSDNLKTDKNFNFDVRAGSAIDIVIHFDLSMSVVASGPESDPTYSLKPVMHLFDDPLKAATIRGSIANSSFNTSNIATVVVIAQSNGEEFTRLEVPMSETEDPTPFDIYWLVPNESYTVQIDLNKDGETIDNDCEEFVDYLNLEDGEVFLLNNGLAIDDTMPDGICQ